MITFFVYIFEFFQHPFNIAALALIAIIVTVLVRADMIEGAVGLIIFYVLAIVMLAGTHTYFHYRYYDTEPSNESVLYGPVLMAIIILISGLISSVTFVIWKERN